MSAEQAGQKEVHPKGANSIAASGLSYEQPLVRPFLGF